MKFPALCLALLVATLGLTTTPSRADEAPPQPDLRALILNAVSSKQTKLVIPPGVYRIGPQANQGVIITISHARDLQIIADGVTMVCTKRMRALAFEHCQNVSLQGLTLDYDPLTFTQGAVIGMAPDKGWLDVKIDAGYPQILFDRIVICDPKTRFHKTGINHLWNTKASWAAPNIIRISRPDVAQNVDLGDPVALSGGQETGACHGITVTNGCSDILLRNVSIDCAPGMGLVDFDNLTGIKMLGCRIAPGPKPVGATQERLLCTSWDAIQCNPARVGAQIERCVIERCGDDTWSVTARGFKIAGREGDAILLPVPGESQTNGGLRVGDHLAFRGPNEKLTQTVQSIENVRRDINGKPLSLMAVTLDGPFAVEVGDHLFNLDCNSRGFRFCNNRIYSHGRGALVEASDGLIEGNTFRGSDKAVMVNPEENGGGSDQLIIRGNTILETGYHQAMPWSEQAGAICLSASAGQGKVRPPGTFSDILIENNRFEGVKGLNLLLTSARNITVRGNQFLKTHQTEPGRHNGADYRLSANAVIEIRESDGVVFENNTVEKGPFTKNVLVQNAAQNIQGAETGLAVR